MFQDFSPPPKNAGDPKRLNTLRKAIQEAGITGFMVPRSDEHQGEYVPDHAERLSWLTGFTGSAGMAIILKEKAAIFIDGRYTLQVKDQVATNILTPVHIADTTPTTWLKDNISKGELIGYDPWLHTVSEITQLEKNLAKTGASLTAHKNLVDYIWSDQPDPPKGQITLHPLKFAGQKAAEKIKNVGTATRNMGASAFLLTQPDSICWLLNIRGNDVPHTPIALGFMIVPATGKPMLFIDEDKLNLGIRTELSPLVTILPQAALLENLVKINGAIGLDPINTGIIFKHHIEAEGGHVIEKDDPCILPKAIKNKHELDGTRAAHIRDGVAVTRFLSWLNQQKTDTLNEIDTAKKLENIRSTVGFEHKMPLMDISFDTISGFGPNGAIVHYRVTQATNHQFSNNTLYLVDSGGQYYDGTTDITRTIAIGTPTTAMKKHFTLVLKGMIAISCARFPVGTSGAQLDILARMALWQAGFDFDHGTGHGVGSFLSVHEGPQRISKVSKIPLEPGMILSNEPGYYAQGAYGIRIENLIVVKQTEAIEGGERPMMGFETITFAPIDHTLIDTTLLNPEECDWINNYHQEVFEKLHLHLESADKNWLRQATKPLSTP